METVRSTANIWGLLFAEPCAKCLTFIGPFIPQNRHSCCSYFALFQKKLELRKLWLCPRSHSSKMAELGFKPNFV